MQVCYMRQIGQVCLLIQQSDSWVLKLKKQSNRGVWHGMLMTNTENDLNAHHEISGTSHQWNSTLQKKSVRHRISWAAPVQKARCSLLGAQWQARTDGQLHRARKAKGQGRSRAWKLTSVDFFFGLWKLGGGGGRQTKTALERDTEIPDNLTSVCFS